jgi:glycerol kinase
LPYGDVASWLLHRLGGVHVCDAGNAARSLLCPLGGADWDDELLDLFGIPRALLPPIADTDRIEATIAACRCAPPSATSRRRCSACAAGSRVRRR